MQPPDPAELNRVAQHYGLGLSDDDISSFSPMVHGLLASWDAVEELYAELKASGLIPGFGGQNRTLTNVTGHGEL